MLIIIEVTKISDLTAGSTKCKPDVRIINLFHHLRLVKKSTELNETCSEVMPLGNALGYL